MQREGTEAHKRGDIFVEGNGRGKNGIDPDFFCLCYTDIYIDLGPCCI